MKKELKSSKIISLVICLAILLSMFSGVALAKQTAFAEEANTDTDTCVAKIGNE